MIRQLKPGEPLPPGEPSRYVAGSGYVRLRWHVAPGQYLETYEHRVDGDRVTTADQVHHRDHDRANNAPENLKPVSSMEHGAEHRRIDRDEAVRRYEAGESLPAIARALGCDNGQLSRLLRAEGVSMRGKRDYYPNVTRAELEAAIGPDTRTPQIAEHFGVSIVTARRWLREHGIRFPAGRPKRSA